MSDKKRFNAEEKIEEYAREHGTYNKEKNSYVIAEKMHNLILNYLKVFLNWK